MTSQSESGKLADPAAIDLEPIKKYYSHYSIMTNETRLIAAVEALRERVAKLNGWLNEHERALAKLRGEMNNAHRKLKAAEARADELAGVLSHKDNRNES